MAKKTRIWRERDCKVNENQNKANLSRKQIWNEKEVKPAKWFRAYIPHDGIVYGPVNRCGLAKRSGRARKYDKLQTGSTQGRNWCTYSTVWRATFIAAILWEAIGRTVVRWISWPAARTERISVAASCTATISAATISIVRAIVSRIVAAIAWTRSSIAAAATAATIATAASWGKRTGSTHRIWV